MYIYCFEAIARNIYSVFVIGKTVSWFTSVSVRHTEQSDVDLALYLIKSSFPIQILNTIFPPASINAAIKWPPMPGFVFFFFKFKTACFLYKRDSPLLVILSNPLRSKWFYINIWYKLSNEFITIKEILILHLYLGWTSLNFLFQ